MVLCGVAGQYCCLLFVTTGAVRGLNVVRVLNNSRFVRLMAGDAILVDHFIGMWLMALQAYQELSVLEVTFFTVQFAVHAWIVGQLCPLVFVATYTHGFNDICFIQIDFQRVVRVVTTAAIIDGVVSFFCRIVAHGAFRYHFASFWRMLKVAVETADSC